MSIARAFSYITAFFVPHIVNVSVQDPINEEKATECKGFKHPGNYIDVPFGGRVMLQFDKNPTKERNGALDSEYLESLSERWKVMQDGPFRNRYKAIAITKLEEAVMWLEKEQKDRAKRNIRFEDKPAIDRSIPHTHTHGSQATVTTIPTLTTYHPIAQNQ